MISTKIASQSERLTCSLQCSRTHKSLASGFSGLMPNDAVSSTSIGFSPIDVCRLKSKISGFRAPSKRAT